MHDLSQLQNRFYQNIFDKENQDISFIRSQFAKERFDVYRYTIFHNMIQALKITFAGIWVLLGDDCANGVAHAFCQTSQHLPKTGCLDDFGSHFPDFLSQLRHLHSIPYLQDYARYEWLKHLAYAAPDSKAISTLDLETIPEDKIDNVIFKFNPSFFLFTSSYPITEIHQIVQDCDAKPFTLSQTASYGVIVRKETETCTYWITKEHWLFLKKLSEGETFSKSVDFMEKYDNAFDLPSAIAFLLQAMLVEKIVYKREDHVC